MASQTFIMTSLFLHDFQYDNGIMVAVLGEVRRTHQNGVSLAGVAPFRIALEYIWGVD